MIVTAYQISDPERIIRQSGPKRPWMEKARNAYRCLPLTMANQLGWEILLEEPVTAFWFGFPGLKALVVRGKPAVSHFGHGILTFHMYSLFRTPPDVNLLVTGPVNRPKKGIVALEGYVETDWSEMSFTMNWQMTAPLRIVRFRAGEPICRILPYPRGYFEDCQLDHVSYEDMPAELRQKHDSWAWRRVDWLKNREDAYAAEKQGTMMGDYHRSAKQSKVCPHDHPPR